MDLIGRYEAIAQLTPSRGDLGRHLGELLRRRVEAREDALGRPLTVEEASAELSAFGRSLRAEGDAVLRRLRCALWSARGDDNAKLEGGSHGPR